MIIIFVLDIMVLVIWVGKTMLRLTYKIKICGYGVMVAYTIAYYVNGSRVTSWDAQRRLGTDYRFD